ASARLWLATGAFERSSRERIVLPSFVMNGTASSRARISTAPRLPGPRPHGRPQAIAARVAERAPPHVGGAADLAARIARLGHGDPLAALPGEGRPLEAAEALGRRTIVRGGAHASRIAPPPRPAQGRARNLYAGEWTFRITHIPSPSAARTS